MSRSYFSKGGGTLNLPTDYTALHYISPSNVRTHLEQLFFPQMGPNFIKNVGSVFFHISFTTSYVGGIL